MEREVRNKGAIGESEPEGARVGWRVLLSANLHNDRALFSLGLGDVATWVSFVGIASRNGGSVETGALVSALGLAVEEVEAALERMATAKLAERTADGWRALREGELWKPLPQDAARRRAS